ncbi:hypothetical protein [Dysgonomonas capnocytophagoides]|uniref:hypothetical protein n=1 Tax=Dysgonomonas capnocytophagoides TaxID=45254 RepID=UPI00333F303B
MMNSKYYDINYAQYAMQLLTNNYRTDMVIAIIKAITAPLNEIHTQFDTLRTGIDFNTYSQVCYMQGLLNDYFDPMERRIRIRNAPLEKNNYLYWKESKKKPVKLHKESSVNFIPHIENRDFQIGTTNIDFEVVFPVGYVLSEEEENKMRNLVNQYKLASKRYIIING